MTGHLHAALLVVGLLSTTVVANGLEAAPPSRQPNADPRPDGRGPPPRPGNEAVPTVGSPAEGVRPPSAGAPLDASLSTRFGADAKTYKNPNVVSFRSGNQISYCPSMSCLAPPAAVSNDHRRTSALISATTQDDGHSQEDSLAVITTIDKGYAKRWAANASYAKGANVLNASQVYRQSAPACVSASNGPTGTGAGLSDGSCRWDWINAAAINAKVGIYNEVKVMPGAGPSWAQTNNYAIAPETPLAFHINTEYDFTNRSGPCVRGTNNCHTLYVRQNGYQATSAIDIGTGNKPGNPDTTEQGYATFWGLRLSGPYLASDAAVQIDTGGKSGIRFGSAFGPAAFSGPAIEDNSTSPTGLAVGGTKAVAAIRDASKSPTGLALAGTYSAAQISGEGWSVSPSGALTTTSVREPLSYTPPSATAPCSVGQHAWDAKYEYRCIAQNTWRRAALSSW